MFRHRPSALANHLRALHPSQGVRGADDVPPIRAVWSRHRIESHQLAEFLALTGLRADHHVPMIYPHVLSFPLQMVVLTHPRFPVPIWKVLQIRNQLFQHRAIATDAVLDMDTVLADQRIVSKGVEFDLHTEVSTDRELVWESTTTFYVRGQFGPASAPPASVRLPSLGGMLAARWQTTDAAGWRFAALTGDYNGIHYWSWYARLMGFRRAFLHPQLVLAQCLSHLDLSRGSERERLDVWLRGPVYLRTAVQLFVSATARDTDFHLLPDDEHRPAVLGRWRSGASLSRLTDAPASQACAVRDDKA